MTHILQNDSISVKLDIQVSATHNGYACGRVAKVKIPIPTVLPDLSSLTLSSAGTKSKCPTSNSFSSSNKHHLLSMVTILQKYSHPRSVKAGHFCHLGQEQVDKNTFPPFLPSSSASLCFNVTPEARAILFISAVEILPCGFWLHFFTI